MYCIFLDYDNLDFDIKTVKCHCVCIYIYIIDVVLALLTGHKSQPLWNPCWVFLFEDLQYCWGCDAAWVETVTRALFWRREWRCQPSSRMQCQLLLALSSVSRDWIWYCRWSFLFLRARRTGYSVDESTLFWQQVGVSALIDPNSSCNACHGWLDPADSASPAEEGECALCCLFCMVWSMFSWCAATHFCSGVSLFCRTVKVLALCVILLLCTDGLDLTWVPWHAGHPCLSMSCGKYVWPTAHRNTDL